MERNWHKEYKEKMRQKEEEEKAAIERCKSLGMERLFKRAAEECQMAMREFERDVAWLNDPEYPMPDAAQWMWMRNSVAKTKKRIDKILSDIESEMLYQALRDVDENKFSLKYILPELQGCK